MSGRRPRCRRILSASRAKSRNSGPGSSSAPRQDQQNRERSRVRSLLRVRNDPTDSSPVARSKCQFSSMGNWHSYAIRVLSVY
jgi:hypothetical protein